MPKIIPFENHVDKYEKWFLDNEFAYQSELLAIAELKPKQGIGVEIGVGSGRFAQPLDIKIGVEPSKTMGKFAENRGIKVYYSSGENLPFKNDEFDFALLVTTICFLDDVQKTFNEIYRILKKNGSILIGFVDKNSPIGKIYEKYKDNNVFYKWATFYSVDDVLNYLRLSKFNDFEFRQTIFQMLPEITQIEKPLPGYGKGSFVVIRAFKKEQK